MGHLEFSYDGLLNLIHAYCCFLLFLSTKGHIASGWAFDNATFEVNIDFRCDDNIENIETLIC